MPELVVSNAALITLAWYVSPVRVWMNVIGARVGPTTTINQSLANTLSTAIAAAFSANFGSHVSVSGALNYTSIRDIRNPNLPEFKGSAALVPGTAVGDALPGNVAAVISLRTAKAGQSFRGRVYLGGMTEADNDPAGGMVASVGTAGVAFINAIGTAFAANGLTLAVVSRPAERVQTVRTVFHGDGTTSVDTHTSESRVGQVTDVTSVASRNTTWDSQRRRTSPGSVSTLFARDMAFAELGGEIVTWAPPAGSGAQSTRAK